MTYNVFSGTLNPTHFHFYFRLHGYSKFNYLRLAIVMVALYNRADHYISILFLSFFLSFFFLA